MKFKKGDMGWLRKPVKEWPLDPVYVVMFNTVNKFAVVNDCAERFIKLVSENISSVRSEKQLSNTILTVAELNQLAKDFKRRSFTKKQLESVIDKMLHL